VSLDTSSGEVPFAASPRETIERQILAVRGLRVMLDHDLANLYGVETKALVQAVKRNVRRFPDDFAFRLTEDEDRRLRSQSVISNKVKEGSRLRSQTVTSNERRGGRRYPPYAFTEQGVAMLSSV
jgi:hypothetical protein